MKNLHTFLLASLSIGSGLVAAVLVAPMLHTHSESDRPMTPMWAHHYDTLSEMAADADLVVLGSVLSSVPGRVVANQRAELPFTLVDIEVKRTLKGEPTDFVVVEKTGGDLGDRSYYVDGDGGGYANGSQVLLFLKSQPETGLYYLANPMGRFAVEGDRLNAVTPQDPVSMALHGRTVTEAVNLVAGL